MFNKAAIGGAVWLVPPGTKSLGANGLVPRGNTAGSGRVT